MAPVKETTPGPSPLSDIKNLLKELHEKVDRLESKVDQVEAKAASKEDKDKHLRMILIGPPGAGTSSSVLSNTHLVGFLHPFHPFLSCLLHSVSVVRWKNFLYFGHTRWNRPKKDQLSCFYFLGSTFPILNQISQHSSRWPIISFCKEATAINQKKRS